MNRFAMFPAAAAVLSMTVLVSAQTTSSSPTTPSTPPTSKTTPAKPPARPATTPATVPAKPQAKATTTPAAAPVATPTAAPASAPAASAGPSASQVVKPAAAWQPYPTTQPAAAASATPPTSAPPAGNVAGAARNYGSNASSPSGDGRAPVGGLGVGSFLWPGGWTLTAYGCFRTDTRLFCDFDTTNTNNLPVSSVIWSGGGGVNVVDDGGKITMRHNAFFVGTDGSQFQTAYVSPQPVRFIIEYDDVDPRYTSVSLVLTSNRIKSVPIFAIDPSQPSGVFPSRSAAGTHSATAPAQTGAAPAANGDRHHSRCKQPISHQPSHRGCPP